MSIGDVERGVFVGAWERGELCASMATRIRVEAASLY